MIELVAPIWRFVDFSQCLIFQVLVNNEFYHLLETKTIILRINIDRLHGTHVFITADTM